MSARADILARLTGTATPAAIAAKAAALLVAPERPPVDPAAGHWRSGHAAVNPEWRDSPSPQSTAVHRLST